MSVNGGKADVGSDTCLRLHLTLCGHECFRESGGLRVAQAVSALLQDRALELKHITCACFAFGSQRQVACGKARRGRPTLQRRGQQG